jgi:hypothetical protein
MLHDSEISLTPFETDGQTVFALVKGEAEAVFS